MAISQDSIQKVLERVDIVTEIGARLQLRKQGANHLGLCPFHGEKTPSFTVNAPKQFYHCFGCGEHGDVIEFLMKHDGMSFTQAVESLAERVGVQLERDKPLDTQEMRRSQMQRERAHELEQSCEETARAYAAELQSNARALNYAVSRGMTAETIQTYGIGYAPAAGRLLQRTDAAQSKRLIEAGLLIEAEDGLFERFRDRLMFPIRDARGRVVGFGGRWIGTAIQGQEPPAKYLNSPETPIFHKQHVLYGLHEARAHINRQKMAFVVEGYMDTVMLAQHGVGNAVAAMGTALTNQQLQLLLRFTDRICMVFDGDAAGRKAARKSLETALPLLDGREMISFLTLPDNQDPDEFLAAHGKERFLSMAKAAPTLSQFMLSSLVAEFGHEGILTSPEAKAQFSTALQALLGQMKPGNRLRAMIQREAQAMLDSAPPGRPLAVGRLVGAPPFHGGHGGPANRVHNAWIGSFTASPAPPAAHQQASLWTRLYDAAALAPGPASAIAGSILPLLDEGSPEEAKLAGLLGMLISGSLDVPVVSPATEERLQAAADLLGSAMRLIERQRIKEVEDELARLRKSGEISEQEYLQQLLELPK